MRRAWRVLAATACGVWLCVAHATWALTPLEQTRTTLDQARAIIDRDQTRNQKLAALSGLLKTFLDTDTMGRAALDTNWSKFSVPQQREFLMLFHELFERTYVQKLLLFQKPDFAYVGEERADGAARVDTKIITPRDEFAVTYQMRLQGDRWVTTDIKIEDLSLTINFRHQLDRLLMKASVEEVLNRMRKKYGANGSGGEDDL